MGGQTGGGTDRTWWRDRRDMIENCWTTAGGLSGDYAFCVCPQQMWTKEDGGRVPGLKTKIDHMLVEPPYTSEKETSMYLSRWGVLMKDQTVMRQNQVFETRLQLSFYGFNRSSLRRVSCCPTQRPKSETQQLISVWNRVTDPVQDLSLRSQNSNMSESKRSQDLETLTTNWAQFDQ